MAKVVIEIEDIPGGKVKVIATPSFETMLKMDLSGENLTSAHGYAFKALNAIREEAKSNKPTKIIIPRVGR